MRYTEMKKIVLALAALGCAILALAPARAMPVDVQDAPATIAFGCGPVHDIPNFHSSPYDLPIENAGNKTDAELIRDMDSLMHERSRGAVNCPGCVPASPAHCLPSSTFTYLAAIVVDDPDRPGKKMVRYYGAVTTLSCDACP